MDSTNKGETMTMAPLVARGKVYAGNFGREKRVRGWMTGFDEATGKQVWKARVSMGVRRDSPEVKQQAEAILAKESAVIDAIPRDHDVPRAVSAYPGGIAREVPSAVGDAAGHAIVSTLLIGRGEAAPGGMS